MGEIMNKTKEDYLKLIYKLSIETNDEFIKTKEIANTFSYTDQSVNEMIKKLKDDEYLDFVPYKGVVLTRKGKEEALRVTKIHRIWEVFLVEKLGFSWKEVHREAEILEHATTEKVANALYKYLGEPSHCTHGSPIPNVNNDLPNFSKESLYDSKVGDKFKLTRVLDDHELLNYLEEKNITLNDTFDVLKVDTFSDTIEIVANHHHHVITKKVAQMMFGRII